ncbi:MAG: hypothetical protein ABIG39_04305 [Candidatus Micrarchaeota archaeon]
MCLNNKGQFFSYDAIVATSIFLITLSIIMVYWWGMEGNTENRISRDVLTVSESLLSRGVPSDWQMGGETKRIGLIGEEGSAVVSLEKWEEFSRMAGKDYDELKYLLATEHDYLIEIRGECWENCSVGKEPPPDADVSRVTRLVVFNGKPASLRVSLWSD